MSQSVKSPFLIKPYIYAIFLSEYFTGIYQGNGQPLKIIRQQQSTAIVTTAIILGGFDFM